MLCFQDTTFCRGDGCAKFSTCHRALTDKVKADAAKWWGGDDAPIAQFANPKELQCYEERQGSGNREHKTMKTRKTTSERLPASAGSPTIYP